MTIPNSKLRNHTETEHTSVEDPMNRPFGNNVFIVPNEVNLLPNIAKEAIHDSLTQIVGTIQPIGAKNTNLELSCSALAAGVQCVEEGGAVVPFKVIQNLTTQLVPYDVEVSTVGPIVPKIDHLE